MSNPILSLVKPTTKAEAYVLRAWVDDWGAFVDDVAADPGSIGLGEDYTNQEVADHVSATADAMVADLIESRLGSLTRQLSLIANAVPVVEDLVLSAAMFLIAAADGSAPDVMTNSEATKFREKAGRCPPGFHFDVESETCTPTESKEQEDKAVGAIADYSALGSLIDDGKLSGTIEEHNKIAKDFIAKHKATLKQTLDDIKSLTPEDAIVKGRAKTVASAVGKLARKPKYKNAANLQDGSGFRVVLKSVGEMDKVAEELKKKYKVVEEDRYVEKSNGEGTASDFGYRSHHLIIQTPDGLQKEIQVRTANQNKHAEWCHDAYKPQTAEQRKVIQENEEDVRSYAIAMGKYMYALDKGEDPGEKPKPTKAVAAAFGTLD
jgi:ppGpp synthetase/RelA/SpoT-type nucleotidyltranferase